MPAMLVTMAGAVAVGVEAALCVAAAALVGGAADVGAAARRTPSRTATPTAMMPTMTAVAFPGAVRSRCFPEG